MKQLKKPLKSVAKKLLEGEKQAKTPVVKAPKIPTIKAPSGINNNLNQIQALSRQMQSSGNIPQNSSCAQQAAAARMTNIANYFSNSPKTSLASGGTPRFLCSSPDYMTNSKTGSQGGLPKVYKGNIDPCKSTGTHLFCLEGHQCAMNMAGLCSGAGLKFAEGGKADCCNSLKCTISDWKQAFCEKNLIPHFVCDKAEFMNQTGKQANTDLAKLKQIKESIACGYATGGALNKYAAAAPRGHNPEFITGMTGYYACGGGTGQSDDIPAMLHDGDYVMDAETVSALGDGSSKAGRHVLDGFRKQVPHMARGGSNPVPAKIADGEYVFPAAFVTALGAGDNKRGAEILDGLRTKLRAQKRSAPLDKIPPKAKNPLDYIKKGK